jgi:NADH-quinone oxidoreductase subunit G
MEPVTEGLIVSVDDQEVKEFRASVIEGLMANHPHDCPVCDEGGECHLQDMTIMTGHNYRRYDFPKRTYNNQELGPFISHEMNRCIQCYRCVRFYRDYAGGKDLNVFASRNQVYFGRHEDGTLENVFSGNLVEVCPTGVFTDKTLKMHYTRKWDLSNAPSVCAHCSVGCNTIASERYGSLRRIMSRYNGAVNGYFICDRGRFGYEFVNDEKRIRSVQIRLKKEDKLQIADNQKVSSSLYQKLSNSKKIIGIGSPRASLESNFALMSLVGKTNFYQGISKKEYFLTKIITEYFRNCSAVIPSLKQIEKADAILVLGEDLTNTAPMMALALRQAARNVPNTEANAKGIPLWNDAPLRELAQDSKSPVFIATPYSDSLDDIAENTFRASTDDIALLGHAVANNIDNKAPNIKSGRADLNELVSKISRSLKNAQYPLIISGVSSGSEDVLSAAFNIITALKFSGSNVMAGMVLPESNSMGLSLLGGKPFEDILSTETEEIDSLIVLENDLFRRAGADAVNELFKRTGHVIVLDSLVNKTSGKADLLLPAAAFAESEGTIVNNEGRAQRYYKAVIPKDQVKESWRWIGDVMKETEPSGPFAWNRVDDIIESMAIEIPLLSKLKKYSNEADFRMLNAKIPRQTMRYSGRTAMNANISVSETKLPQDADSPFTFSMEGQDEQPPSSLVPFYWSPGWNSVQAVNYYLNEPGASMKGGDPGIRLFDSSVESDQKYIDSSTDKPEMQKDEWLVVSVYQIFGSEELSVVSTSVLQRVPEPFILMNQNDADKLKLKAGDVTQLEVLKTSITLKVKIDNALQKGVTGITAGLPGMPYFDLPGTGKFHKL